jgi:colanic acid/amylovoran biosynthesis glycosyltransferase
MIMPTMSEGSAGSGRSAMSGPSLIYVTSRLPAGDGEPFITGEVHALEHAGWQVTVVPARGEGRVVHADAELLQAWALPLLSWETVTASLAELFSRPRRALGGLALLGGARSPSLFLKNLAVLPKALWLSRRARRSDAVHIHAHWASTPSTLAMLASRVSGIPWSFTAHRWDIAEDNLLRAKVESACFVRVISQHGAEELLGIVGLEGFAPTVLPMGVELPPRREVGPGGGETLRVLTPARLVEKKGHEHLLEAVPLLRARGVAVRLDLAGEGPLGPVLRQRVKEGGLEDEVAFLGTVSHEELLRRLGAGEWDAVVLPSVVTKSGELEGIPVALIEAMAQGVPVVGTETGGIPELLGGGAGMLVPPEDPGALAAALAELASDPARRAALAAAGRARVEERFDVNRVAAALAARFLACSERLAVQ